MQFRKTLVIGMALGLLVVLAPLAAYGAVSLFDDVPDDDIFVQDINWMKTTGVSKGCNPPLNTEYCPKDFVRRDQMAAFLHRLAENQVVDAGSVQGLTADELKGQTGDTGPAGPKGDPGAMAFYVQEATFSSPDTPPEPPKPYTETFDSIELLGELVSCESGDVAVDAMGVRVNTLIDKDTGTFSTVSTSPDKHNLVFFPTSGTAAPTGYGFIRPQTLEHGYIRAAEPDGEGGRFNAEYTEQLTIRVTCADMTP